MSLDFSWLPQYEDAIIRGILVTIRLTLIGGGLGFLLGIATAWSRVHGGKALRTIVIAYI